MLCRLMDKVELSTEGRRFSFYQSVTMLCEGYTKSGRPCRNRASANGYCHLHGGIPSRRARQNEFRRAYAQMTPEQRAEHDRMKFGCVLIIIAFALLYGILTGDWEGIGNWFTR